MGYIPVFVRFLALCLVLLPFEASAQISRSFNASLSAPATASAQTFVDGAENHSLQVNVVSPTTCTIRLEGSLDGLKWSDLSGPQPCTSSTMFHVDGKPMVFVRAYLITYAGDQGGAKVVVIYKGVGH